MRSSPTSKSRPNSPKTPNIKSFSSDSPQSSRIKKREERGQSPSLLSSTKQGVILTNETSILEVLKKKSDNETITTSENEPKMDLHISDFNYSKTNICQHFGKKNIVSNMKQLDESSDLCKTLLQSTSIPSLVVQENMSNAKPIKTANFLEDEVMNGPKPESENKSQMENDLNASASQETKDINKPEVIVKTSVKRKEDEESKRPKISKASKSSSESDKKKKCYQGDADVDDYKESRTQVKFTIPSLVVQKNTPKAKPIKTAYYLEDEVMNSPKSESENKSQMENDLNASASQETKDINKPEVIVKTSVKRKEDEESKRPKISKASKSSSESDKKKKCDLGDADVDDYKESRTQVKFTIPSLVVQKNTPKAKPIKTAYFLEDEVMNGPKSESENKSQMENDLSASASQETKDINKPEVIVKTSVKRKEDEESKGPKISKASKYSSKSDNKKKCCQGDADVDDYKESRTQVKFTIPSLVVQKNTPKAKPIKTAYFLEDEVMNGPKSESENKSQMENDLNASASQETKDINKPEVIIKTSVKRKEDEESKRSKISKASKSSSESDKKKKCDQGDADVDDYKESGTQDKFTKQGVKAVMQKCLNQGLKQITASTPKRKKKIRLMDWKRYHRLNVIYAFLDDLEREYPAICTVTTIGRSVEGREIKMIKISNSDANNSPVWLDGSIHSREWISAAVVTYIVDAIVKHFSCHPNSVTNKDWHIVPVVNPDGYEYSHTHDRMWRKNCCKIDGERVGVDLNRNFSYGWGFNGDEGSSEEPKSAFYRGPRPFSEPESVAVRDAILQSGLDFKVFLSFHSYFQLIIFPWGYKAEPCSAYLKLLEGGLEMARAIQSCYGLTYKVGCTKDLTYCACGTSIDWSFAVPKIPYSYMVELRSRKHKFKLPREQILPNSIEVWEGVQKLMEYVDANDLDLQLIDPQAATIG